MADKRWHVDPRAKNGGFWVETIAEPTPRRKKRTSFKPRFAQVPIYWVTQLEKHNSAALYQLAHRVLLEAHKRKQLGGEIILSTAVTGLPRQTRARTIKLMVGAEMIKISQHGNQAARVIKLLHVKLAWARW
jgi:hypothetical protein